MLVVVTDSQFRVASDPDGSIGSCGTTIWTHSSCKRLCVWIFSLHAKDSFIQNYNHLMYIEKDLETSIRTWFYSLSLSLSRTILFLWQTRSDTQFVSSTFRIFKSLSNKTKSSVPFSILKKLVPILISSSLFSFQAFEILNSLETFSGRVENLEFFSGVSCVDRVVRCGFWSSHRNIQEIFDLCWTWRSVNITLSLSLWPLVMRLSLLCFVFEQWLFLGFVILTFCARLIRVCGVSDSLDFTTFGV